MKREDLGKEIDLHIEEMCKRLVGKCIVTAVYKGRDIYVPADFIHAMKVLDCYINDDLCHLVGIDKDGMFIPLNLIFQLVIGSGWCKTDAVNGGMRVYAIWDKLIDSDIDMMIS